MSVNFKRLFLNALMAVIAALVSICLFGTYGGVLGLLTVVVLAAAFGAGINYLTNKHEARLRKRIEADVQITFDVLMNGVKVGSVTDAEYATMERFVFRDLYVSVQQSFFNVVRIAFSVLDKLIIAVPVMCFWGFIFVAVYAPESFSEISRELLNADVTQLSSEIRPILSVVVSVAVLTVFVMGFLGARFGYRNYYREAIDRRLRFHCETPAEGTICLIRSVSTGKLSSAEMSSVMSF